MYQLYAIDNTSTFEKDDAFNVTLCDDIATIQVAMPYMLDINNKTLSKAREKHLSTYINNDYMFNNDLIEKKTLKNGQNKVFLLTVELNINNLEIIKYDFSIDNVNIFCKNFDNYKTIQNFENIEFVANMLAKRRLQNNKLIYVRPSLEYNLEEDNYKDRTHIKYIISMFTLLTNELAAKRIKEIGLNNTKSLTKKDSLTLRGANKVYFEKNINSRKASFYNKEEILMSNFMLSSTEFNSLKFDNYTYITSPLRRYVDIIVQDFIINNSTDYSLPDKSIDNYITTFINKESSIKKQNSTYNDLKIYHYYKSSFTQAEFLFKIKDRKYFKLESNDIVMTKDKYFSNIDSLSAKYYNNQLIFSNKL